jgi:hypothetical protein
VVKVVINDCFGGFGLSPRAVKRLAELQGRDCHFFRLPLTSGSFDTARYEPIALADAERELLWWSFDIADPNAVLKEKPHRDRTDAEKDAHNAAYRAHHIDSRPDDRSDPLLVQVVEELGETASGRCARLKVVEIPDGVEWQIEEYDGNEHVTEKHCTWS